MTDRAWLTAEDVHAHVVGGSATLEQLEPYTAAAAAYVEARTTVTVAAARGDVDDDVRLGACILAARLYARRGTSLGLQGYDGMAATILRQDPDVARLVGVGVHTAPDIG